MTGASNDLVMPKLGLTMAEGLLSEWHVAEGDTVHAGDVLFVVETDKIANEIEAPEAGTIEAILVPAGETVAVGTPVARWTGPGLPPFTEQPEAAESRPEASTGAAPSQAAQRPTGRRIVATPLARRLARQKGIELGAIVGSGPRGRIKAADVEQAMKAPVPSSRAEESGRLVEPTSIEIVMAQRMAAAKREVPHFYVTADADLSRLEALRRAFNADADTPHLTLTHFAVAAVVHALAQNPEDNRIWEDGQYRVFDQIDVGVAVATDRGLLVPVLRRAQALSLPEIAWEHDRLVEKARSASLSLQEVSGGAITISNLGMHGVSAVHPIINAPQSMILGIGAVRSVCVLDETGSPRARNALTLVLAADHRVFDGVRASALLRRIVQNLSRPHGLLAPSVSRATAP